MRAKTASCIAAACLAAACANVSTVRTTGPGLVGVDRSQYLTFPADQFDRSMADVYALVKKDAEAHQDWNQNEALVQRVRAIAQRLIPHTDIFRLDAPAWEWEVNVIRSPQINAFSFAKGKIVFFSGLIQNLRLSDDEIAAIIGHEIAHMLREHGRERASEQSRTKVLTGLIGAVVGGGEDDLADLSALFYLLPNSREQETEADRMGLELAARAGYDPKAAVAVWRKFRHVTGSGQPTQFASTHPSHESRLRDLQNYSEKVAASYKLGAPEK
jgi:predicted Zn-dependent protease